MLAVLLIGVAAARTATNGEKSARHERDRHIALGAAEAALLDAERDVEGGADPASARAAYFAPGGAAGFVEGCGQGATSANFGLCRTASGSAAPAWQSVDLADAGIKSVPYGRFTGAAMPIAAGMLPARLPGYIIELVQMAGATPDDGAFYRITAIGFGSRATTRVVLQSYYHKPAPAPPAQGAPTPADPATPATPATPANPEAPDPPRDAAAAHPPLPAGRIGWREISNWPELHEATLK